MAVSVTSCRSMKQKQQKITMLTAYDASFAQLFNDAGVEILLVGDSLSSVIHGTGKSPVAVTVDDIAYHTRCVANGNVHALLIADMPFMSFHNTELALKNAARFIQAGAAMVKMEGGAWLAETVNRLSVCGIPVCGHIGLSAQSVNKVGGYKIQGRDQQSAERIYEDALALQVAGIDLLVLECMPAQLAADITQALSVPTIGIGAGVDCDGQVLVSYDMLGLTPGKPYTFVKQFLDQENPTVPAAARAYVQAVKNQTFPTLAHTFQ